MNKCLTLSLLTKLAKFYRFFWSNWLYFDYQLGRNMSCFLIKLAMFQCVFWSKWLSFDDQLGEFLRFFLIKLAEWKIVSTSADDVPITWAVVSDAFNSVLFLQLSKGTFDGRQWAVKPFVSPYGVPAVQITAPWPISSGNSASTEKFSRASFFGWPHNFVGNNSRESR